MGLPHRNYSVFKQTHINQWAVQVVKVRRRTHPAQWVGLRALIIGLGVGGRKRKEGNDSLPIYRLFKIANILVRIIAAPRSASMINTSISMPMG